MADTAYVTHASAGFNAEKPALKMDRVDSVMKNDTTIITPGTTTKKPAAAATTTTAAPAAGVANPSGDEVRVLGLHEWKAAGLSLAEAFKDDEVSRYFVDTPDRAHWSEQQKYELHVKIMEFITYAHLLKGLVVCAGPNYDCVALWMPPGNNMDDYLTIFRSGMWRLNYLLSTEGKNRFFTEFLPLLHDTKASVMGPRDDDSYYLVYIGTKPSGRGKGYARKVIDFVTAMADAEGRACYLESSNVVNRRIYGKMGFELRKNIFLQRAAENVELDIMVREPVAERVKREGMKVVGREEK